MPLEKRSPSTLAGVLALAAVFVLAAFFVIVPDAWRRTTNIFYYATQGDQPAQPLDYTHRRHAGIRKIPCLYCHAGIDRGAKAIVPSLSMCMNCHMAIPAKGRPKLQQLVAWYGTGTAVEWTKVHDLPDFVRFNHRQHLAAGVVCQTCHGPIQDMNVVQQWAPLTMGWCVNCHRDSTATGRHNAPVTCQTCHY